MQNVRHSLLAAAVAGIYAQAQLQEGGSPAAGNDGVAVNTSTNGAAKPAKKEIPPPPPGMYNETFHFRKEKITDEAGNEVESYKHPSVVIPLPLPTVEQLKEIFNAPSDSNVEGNKASEQAFIISQVKDAFYLHARDQINNWREDPANKGKEVDANMIDYSTLTITALANMPASERGNKLEDEEINDFVKDYSAVMVQATGKDASKIKAQATLLSKLLRPVKTDKKVLGAMQNFLAVWAGSTPNLEEHQKVYEYLKNRVEKWLKSEPKNVFDQIV